MARPQVSIMRDIYAGRRCAICSTVLTERRDGRSGALRCDNCFQNSRRVVHMNFVRYAGVYRISFLEADCRTSLPWKGKVTTEDALYRIVRRTLEPLPAERDLENCLRHWRQGTVKLRITLEQYLKLKRQGKPRTTGTATPGRPRL